MNGKRKFTDTFRIKRSKQNQSGQWQYLYLWDNPTLYASPYLVATKHGYTKHYYAENERLLCKIGDGTIDDIDLHVVDTATLARKQTAVNQAAPNSQYTSSLSNLATLDGTQGKHPELYWQHSDHLGSASWITDTVGRTIQHLQYMPWGEPLLDYRNPSTSYSARYTFSGKERDEESGFSYFGARYYNSAYSIWLSMDPMSDKYPSLSPYAYCGNNPVKLVDASGEEIVIKDGNHYYTYRNGSLFLNNKEVSIDKNSFAGKTLKSLNLINRTEMGRTMISDLQKTENEGGKTITITAGTKSKFDLQSGTLLWNTNGSKVPLFHEVAFEDAPMDLAHELSHAYDYNNDWTDRTETSGLERSEWVACYRENRVRSELVKPRAYREYYKVIRTPEGKYGGGTGPRLLNKDNLPFLPFNIDSYEKK